jgi:hypothetical protein
MGGAFAGPAEVTAPDDERKAAELAGFLKLAASLPNSAERAAERETLIREAFTAGQLSALTVLREAGLIKAKRPRGRPATTTERNAGIVATIEDLLARGMVLKAARSVAEAVHNATPDQVRHAWKNRTGQ